MLGEPDNTEIGNMKAKSINFHFEEKGRNCWTVSEEKKKKDLVYFWLLYKKAVWEPNILLEEILI